MNDRQQLALTNPLNDPYNLKALARLRGARRHAAGFVIQSILAVDR